MPPVYWYSISGTIDLEQSLDQDIRKPGVAFFYGSF
jgi:hypothetical protein